MERQTHKKNEKSSIKYELLQVALPGYCARKWKLLQSGELIRDDSGGGAFALLQHFPSNDVNHPRR